MLMVTVAWQGDTGAVLGSSIRVHEVMAIVAIRQVTFAMVGIGVPQGMGIRMVHVMGAECKFTRVK